MPKNWIFTSSQDYSPGGTLTLGQILEDAFEPGSALISAQTGFEEDRRQDSSWKEDVNSSSSFHLDQSFCAYCKLNNFDCGGSVSGSKSSNSKVNWHLDRLDSEGFLPMAPYIEKALKTGDVPRKTQWWKLRRRLYMVTGLRIARGSSMQIEKGHSSNVGVGIQVDGTSQGVPVSTGIDAQRAHTQQQSESAGKMSDFIFAYRLDEVTYRLWVNHTPISSGQTESTDRKEREPEEDEEPEGYAFTGLDTDPFEGEDDERLTE